MTTDLDQGFVSLYDRLTAAQERGGKPVTVAVRDDGGHTASWRFAFDGDVALGERLVKTLLWAKGGCEIVCDDADLADCLRGQYATDGTRAFDAAFFADVYGTPLTVTYRKDLPDCPLPAGGCGGNFDGCRIGLDVGGSEIKFCAVRQGEPVFSGRQPWQPLQYRDPDEHFAAVCRAIDAAAARLPRLDAVGVSTAGVVVDGELRVSSLFRSVAKADYPRAQQLWKRVAARYPQAAFACANDGDVAALSGGLNLGETNLLGLSLGTSLAGGALVKGGVNGWLNELAFVPIDVGGQGTVDEWSGDVGCGVKYLSQDGVLRLAEKGGFAFPKEATLSERMHLFAGKADEALRAAVFGTVGKYLAHGLLLWHKLYGFDAALLMGGVTAAGGREIFDSAQRILTEKCATFRLLLPHEGQRGVGQSLAAASIPVIVK